MYVLREVEDVVIWIEASGYAIACLNPCKLYELNPLVFSPLSLRVKGGGLGEVPLTHVGVYYCVNTMCRAG